MNKNNKEASANKTDQNKATSKELSNQEAPAYIAIESAIGASLILASKSPNHKHIFLSELETTLFPSIVSKQFIIMRNKNHEPIAFVNWALVNEDVEKRMLGGVVKLRPNDWSCGNKIYIIDIISPFVANDVIIKQLSNEFFKDKEAKIIISKKDSKELQSKTIHDLFEQKAQD